MSLWVHADIEISRAGKFSVKRACADITNNYGGSLKRNEINPNLYHLSYPDDGLHVAKELQEICEAAKRFDCKLTIHIISLYLF